MTEGTTPAGAPARVTSIDVHIDQQELAMATLRLGQIVRLHQAEAVHAIRAASTMTAREVADAWSGANRPLVNALADLEEIVAMLAAHQPAISAALNALEDLEANMSRG